MSVINLKAAKQAAARKRYSALVLDAWDRQSQQQRRTRQDHQADVRRKAKEQF